MLRFLLYFLMPISLVRSQYEIKLSNSNYADIAVKFTSSNYADIDIRFVESEYAADFTVGFTDSKYKATVILSKANYADIDVKITESNYADLDVKISNSSYADLSIMIKKSGIVDYLIYSDGYLDKNEIIIACLPIIKNFKEDLKLEGLATYIDECGSIVKPEYETYISDEFEGWDSDNNIYELDNGLKVSSDTYTYSYSYRPSISLYYCNRWFASVDGEKLVPVNVYR